MEEGEKERTTHVRLPWRGKEGERGCGVTQTWWVLHFLASGPFLFSLAHLWEGGEEGIHATGYVRYVRPLVGGAERSVPIL